MFEFGIVSGLLVIYGIVKFMIWQIQTSYNDQDHDKEWDWI